MTGNFGFTSELLDLALLIKELMSGSFEIIWDTSKENGQPRRILDIDRAKKVLGFNPKTDITAGLRKTIQFYVDRYSHL